MGESNRIQCEGFVLQYFRGKGQRIRDKVEEDDCRCSWALEAGVYIGSVELKILLMTSIFIQAIK